MSHEKRRPDKEGLDTIEVPRHQKRAPKKKRYGIEYFSRWFNIWHNRTWYVTAKARDQAFESLADKTSSLPNTMTSEARKVDR